MSEKKNKSLRRQEDVRRVDEEVFEEFEDEEDFSESDNFSADDSFDDDDIDDDELYEDEDEEGEKKKKKVLRRRGKRRRQKKMKENKGKRSKKAWIIGGSIIGGLLVIYLGISAFFISHFYINTTINGKDFSGKTESDVVAYMKDQVEGYSLKIIEADNKTDEINGEAISMTYKKDDSVKDALKNQNPLLWIRALFSKSSAEVTINVDYNEDALSKAIGSIQAVKAEQTEPVSAYPKFDGESFKVEPEVYGSAVDMEILTKKIKEYITNFEPELNLLNEKCYKVPKYTTESKEVQKACDDMNKYCQASITYPMKENVVVDKALISTWVSADADMNVTFNEEAVRAWMRDFGKTYDTVGTTRTITSPTGKTVEVSGGTYGWSIDEEAETQNLIASIKNGEVVTREPAYEKTAASHAAQDWGTTYLEVDLSAQHMWYIVNGAIALETDVVTGLPDAKHATPAGVYSILYTEPDSKLIGEKDPETGKPIYETYVRYWMPFTYQGHGFHDADWQTAFGGSRYQSYGSHGCVNMPVDQAGALFNMLSAGTPVVLHY